jgi:diaminohydroxyphosphoribosylaminopyrimidine deaminase/5-amino-6-(5-phosphoribosylamino)uracil reductase
VTGPDSGAIEAHMRRAIALSAEHRPHPNPRVGAVVLDPEGRVVGEGSHAGLSHPHAEVNALRQAGDRAREGTVIVTLEPCNHQGLTPPCTSALLAAGVRRVFYGAEDPDPRVAGAGAAALAAAGVEVNGGMLGSEVEIADPGYFHHRRSGLPLLTLKVAMTLDGQVAAADGTSQWITGPEAREDAHRLRANADAVLIGAGTLRRDDPSLDVRLEGYTGPQPRPVVVAGRQALPVGVRVLARNPLAIVTRPSAWAEEIVVDPGPDGMPDLRQAAAAIGGRGYLDVLVEGGPRLAAALLASGLIQRGVFYVAGRLAGGMGFPVFQETLATITDSRPVEITAVTRVGVDLRVEWRIIDTGQ